MLPPDSAVNKKIMDGAFIVKLVNKSSLLNENLCNLLKYMVWEDFGATCAVVSQLFVPSRNYMDRLNLLEDLATMDDSLKQMRIRLIFSPSLQTKAPCGIFSVIKEKSLDSGFDIQPYLSLILRCVKEYNDLASILLRDRKPDLLAMEQIGVRELEKKYGKEKAQRILFTNEFNSGIPRRVAAERHGLSSDSGFEEIQNDAYCRFFMDFRTLFTNRLIEVPEEEEMAEGQSPESHKLAEDNARLKELYAALVLQKDMQRLNRDFDEKTGEVVGDNIEKVGKPKNKKRKKEATEGAAAGNTHADNHAKQGTQASSQSGGASLSDDQENSIRELINCTGRSRDEVIAALQRHEWDPNEASFELLI